MEASKDKNLQTQKATQTHESTPEIYEHAREVGVLGCSYKENPWATKKTCGANIVTAFGQVMSVVPNSTAQPWIRAAKKRWPNYTVTCDLPSAGRFAVVNRSLASVHLFGFAMFAQQFLNARPEPADLLALEELTPDYGWTSTPQPVRVNTYRDRDDDDRWERKLGVDGL